MACRSARRQILKDFDRWPKLHAQERPFLGTAAEFAALGIQVRSIHKYRKTAQ
jgi:hypothetical protein